MSATKLQNISLLTVMSINIGGHEMGKGGEKCKLGRQFLGKKNTHVATIDDFFVCNYQIE